MRLGSPWERRALQGIWPPDRRLLRAGVRAADPGSVPPTADEQHVWVKRSQAVSQSPSEATGMSGGGEVGLVCYHNQVP